VQVYDSAWIERERRGEIDRAGLRKAANEIWNVVKELHIQVRAVKPWSGPAA
ncbi:MAG: hypothetical protein IOB84_02475, partial [Brevundimonas sp.]|nr:hypothetical protein [Brevundimonas sp.]